MGTYTTLATFAKAPRYGRAAHVGGRLENGLDGERATHSYTHVCPQCGEGATVAAECPRCDVEMRSTKSSVGFPKPSNEVRDRTTRSLGAAALGLGVAFGVPAYLFYATASIDNAIPSPYPKAHVAIVAACLLASLAFLALAPIALSNWFPRLQASREWRQVLQAARTRLRSVAAFGPADAPSRTATPVRVQGEIRIDGDSVHVTDGRHRVRIPVDARVRVIDGDTETHHLEEGQRVEVVGVGARELGAGEAYRDTRGDFVFDVRQPVEVWIS